MLNLDDDELEGFTQAECDLLNQAVSVLMKHGFPEMHAENIAVNNWSLLRPNSVDSLTRTHLYGGATMVIHFSAKPATYTPNTTVAFPAMVDGIEVMCEISAEALADHFEAVSMRGADLVAAFQGHRAEVEAMARAVLPQRLPSGRCLLVSQDF
jgi:hypothetical protein